MRKAVGARAARGNVTVGLRLSREVEGGALAVNPAALAASLSVLAEVEAGAKAQGLALRAPSVVEIAGMRGVVEQQSVAEDVAPLREALLSDFSMLLDEFNAMREVEGAALAKLLDGQLTQVSELVAQAREMVETRKEAQAEALKAALERVTAATDAVEPERIAQELALIAVKTDIREELDRLEAHVAQARSLLAGDGARGRKFDFLTQEFNREANTLCSKSQHQPLTAIGLDLKAVIEQMREQVQNVE